MLSAAVDPDKGIIFYKDFVSMMVVEDLQHERVMSKLCTEAFFSIFCNITFSYCLIPKCHMQVSKRSRITVIILGYYQKLVTNMFQDTKFEIFSFLIPKKHLVQFLQRSRSCNVQCTDEVLKYKYTLYVPLVYILVLVGEGGRGEQTVTPWKIAHDWDTEPQEP